MKLYYIFSGIRFNCRLGLFAFRILLRQQSGRPNRTPKTIDARLFNQFSLFIFGATGSFRMFDFLYFYYYGFSFTLFHVLILWLIAVIANGNDVVHDS